MVYLILVMSHTIPVLGVKYVALKIRILLKHKQVSPPITSSDPAPLPDRFAVPTRELLQSLDIASVGNEAEVITGQPADYESLHRDTVTIVFNCISLVDSLKQYAQTI